MHGATDRYVLPHAGCRTQPTHLPNGMCGVHLCHLCFCRSARLVGHSQTYASPAYRGVVEGGLQVSQQSAPYRGESVYDDLGLDYGRVEAARERPWIDIVIRA